MTAAPPGEWLRGLTLEDAGLGLRLLRALPGFLRHPVRTDEARALLAERLGRREQDFLALVTAAVFDHPGSPYRPLFRHAGCEPGDLAALVGREGVEGALTRLLDAGVYLTVEEFKGRRPLVRGGRTMPFDPNLAANPGITPHVAMGSSGSRGRRVALSFDLAYVRDTAVDRCLAYDAWGGRAWVKALWVVPGGSGMVDLLEQTFESRPVRWFSQVDPAASGLHPRYRWGVRALRWGSRLAPPPLPRPRRVPVDDPRPIVDWMLEVRRGGRTPHLYTFASSAVRVCQAARDLGVDLRGTAFTLIGEPMTAARLGTLQRAGALAMVDYGASETASFAYGCLAPDGPDDVHLCHDLLAVIQPGAAGRGGALPDDALLFSTLRPRAPVVMLNVSLGDRARLDARACRCPLAGLGWRTHLRAIRSFEKLTAAGMTFLEGDVIRILEEVLPARFGGVATDYQLIEDEDASGRPEIRLVVHPRVGPVDPAAIADSLLGALGGGSGTERVMELLWRDARLVRLERRPPYTTATGKILHLHQAPRAPSGRAPRPSSGSHPA